MSTYITTYSKIHFTPLEPDPGQISVRDIAHALSLMTRANGHFPEFYSVGQHCLHCAEEARAEGLPQRLILACLLVVLLRTGAVPALLVWLLGCSALILLVCSRNIFIRKDPAAAAFRAACILLRVLLRCAGLIVDIFLRVLIFLWGLAACFKFLFIHIEKPPCIRSAKHLCRMIDVFGFHDFYYTGNL